MIDYEFKSRILCFVNHYLLQGSGLDGDNFKCVDNRVYQVNDKRWHARVVSFYPMEL